jgi:cyclomaltodextrinase / maltogenic alpha-amylase / neopullulanase
MAIDAPGWVRDAVFYQVFPDRFAASDRVPKPGRLEAWDVPPTTYGFKGGDLLGIAEHLPDLHDLGITALYLTPIFQSAANHRYHTYDYFTVDPLLGGDAALRELLDQAHQRGMRVILDGVFNHTGRGFWPFHHLLENGAASPYHDWFHLDDGVLTTQGLDAYPDRGGRSGPPRLGYEAWWGLPALPKLNTDHPAVRDYLFRVAEHWLRFGADGWRLDVPMEIADAAFWQEFRRRCRAVRDDAYLVGEIWRLAPDWLQGDRFDAVMNYPLAEAILGFAGGKALDFGVINSHYEYSQQLKPLDGRSFGTQVIHLAAAYDPSVVASQLNLLGSHDAPRMRTVLGRDVQRVRLAALFQLTLPGAPCIYYGDELGLSGGADPANRAGYPWTADEQAAAGCDPTLRDTVMALAHLRHAEPAFRQGPLRMVGGSDVAVAFELGRGSSRFVVVGNAGDAETALTVSIADAPAGAGGHLAPMALPGLDAVTEAPIADGRSSIRLPARAGAVMRVV